MKRYILIVAAVALATVSCSRNYDVNPAGEGAEIGFGTWAENLTKARVQGSNTFTNGDDFAVYGYKEVTSPASKTTVFDDVVVSTTDGTTWTYSPTRYWDKNADQYVFYAISPSSVGTAATVNPQTGEITSTGITFSGKNSDILVADKETVVKANYNKQVELDFNHVASLVDFKVSKASTLKDAVVKVTAFTLSNIEDAGEMSVNDAYNASVYNGTTGPVVTWSSTGKGSYTPASAVNAVTLPQTIAEDDAFVADPAAAPAEGKSTMIVNNLIVKPQAFTVPTDAERADPATAATAQKLTITYTIEVTGGGVNEYTSTIFLYDFDMANDKVQDASTFLGGWLTGKHYTFYITLDSNPITFSAKVNEWTVGTGYHYLLN